MASSDEQRPSLLNVLVSVLAAGSNLGQLITILDRLLAHIPWFIPATGMYEVLGHQITLELLDSRGETAVYHKRQKVRFLQDNIIAYQDKVWGDGDIFAAYRCSPGVAVDRYREGHYYRVLISLRERKHRGDLAEFFIDRTIRGGFTGTIEELQTEVDHKTNHLSLSVIFPSNRHPKQVQLAKQNEDQIIALGPEQFQRLPDGRDQVTWTTDHPRQFEAYRLRWEW